MFEHERTMPKTLDHIFQMESRWGLVWKLIGQRAQLQLRLDVFHSQRGCDMFLSYNHSLNLCESPIFIHSRKKLVFWCTCVWQVPFDTCKTKDSSCKLDVVKFLSNVYKSLLMMLWWEKHVHVTNVTKERGSLCTFKVE